MSKEQQTPWTKEIYTWVASMKCARVGKNPDHIYFCCKGRKGTISFYEGTIIELVVEDNGNGIDPQDLPHLFERFYRGKDAEAASVGIGLNLARRIIRKQNGTVKAENRREGGARFCIRFYKGVI